MKKIPITIVVGYLGSGKTTLLNHILKNKEDIKAAVIVNDVGEINIDSTLISQSDGINFAKDQVVSLSNGCICCSLQDGLTEAIETIIDSGKFDHIFIEASGVSEPIPIAQSILFGYTKQAKLLSNLCYIDSLITVVDSHRMATEFNLNGPFDRSEPIAELICEQIEFCNVVILNKTDLVTKSILNQVREVVEVLQPKARIIESTYSHFPIKEVLQKQLFDFDELVKSAGWIQVSKTTNVKRSHHQITSFTYQANRPFDLYKLEILTQNYPKDIIRTKGIIWISADHEHSVVLSQAGQQVSLVEGTPWVGSYPKMFQDEVLKMDANLRDKWDEKFKDRSTQLVIIGKSLDQKRITALYDECLLSRKELESSYQAYLRQKIAKGGI